MNRLLVFALVASIGNTSIAFAGESLLSSGSRHVQQMAVVETVAPAATAAAPAALPSTVGKKNEAAALQQSGGSISKSGMSKGKKAMLYLGLAAVFVAGVYTIDNNVVDVTPSSLGTRQD